MAHTENTLKHLKKENLFALVLMTEKVTEQSLWKNSSNVWILYLTRLITYQVNWTKLSHFSL